MKNMIIQKLIEDGLIKSGRALDLGYGKGEAAEFLAENGFEVEAVDIKEDIEQKSIPNVTFIKSDIRDFPITENTYDFIFARNILPLIKKSELKDCIDKINLGLKKGGVMFFTLFGEKDEWNGVKKNMTFLSDSEIQDVVEGVTPIYNTTIKLGQGETIDGGSKFCHIYAFTCVKK